MTPEDLFIAGLLFGVFGAMFAFALFVSNVKDTWRKDEWSWEDDVDRIRSLPEYDPGPVDWEREEWFDVS